MTNIERNITKLIYSVMYVFIMPFLWYTFDDQLALILSNPAIGTIPYWNMFAFIYFMAGFLGYPIYSGITGAKLVELNEEE